MSNPLTTSGETSSTSTSITTRSATPKRQRTTHQHQEDDENHHHHQSLLPGLPDHIARLCLSPVHPSVLYSVCNSWRRLIFSSSFPPFLSIYALLLSTKNTSSHQPHVSSSIKFSSFDPISSHWFSLPPSPDEPPLRFLLRHPSFISRNLPIQSVSVLGNLVLLAATGDQFVPALSRPLVFNPLARKWTFGPPLATPRRWCAAGALRGAVYVVSGMGSHYNPDVARSVEKWDPEFNNNNNHHHSSGNKNHTNNKGSKKRNGSLEKRWKWEKMGGLKDSKFSREAIDAIGWRGKLCMVNVKGDAAKEGIIYDVRKDSWEDMPDGMLMGWRGPAAAIDEETIYVVDESKGLLKKYDPGRDNWVEIVENEMFKGAQCVAAGGGRVCVVCGGGVRIAVVDVVASPPRFWVVDTPPEHLVLSIHILPRMSQPDFQLPIQGSTSME